MRVEDYLKTVTDEKYDKIFFWVNFDLLFPDFVSDYYKNGDDKIEYLSFAMQLSSEMIMKSNNCSTKCWLTFEDSYLQFYILNGSEPTCNYLIDKINMLIFDTYKDEVEFIDLKSIVVRIGHNNAYTLKHKLRWNAPYSKDLVIEVVARLYKKF